MPPLVGKRSICGCYSGNDCPKFLGEFRGLHISLTGAVPSQPTLVNEHKVFLGEMVH